MWANGAAGIMEKVRESYRKVQALHAVAKQTWCLHFHPEGLEDEGATEVSYQLTTRMEIWYKRPKLRLENEVISQVTRPESWAPILSPSRPPKTVVVDDDVEYRFDEGRWVKAKKWKATPDLLGLFGVFEPDQGAPFTYVAEEKGQVSGRPVWVISGTGKRDGRTVEGKWWIASESSTVMRYELMEVLSERPSLRIVLSFELDELILEGEIPVERFRVPPDVPWVTQPLETFWQTLSFLRTLPMHEKGAH